MYAMPENKDTYKKEVEMQHKTSPMMPLTPTHCAPGTACPAGYDNWVCLSPDQCIQGLCPGGCK